MWIGEEFVDKASQHIYFTGTASGGKQGGFKRAMCVSYSRVALNQTGDGHLSPLGGYDAQTDSVLIFDVARFKYPPYWITIEQLHNAMLLIDPCLKSPVGLVS
jgi:hypothetical protein